MLSDSLSDCHAELMQETAGYTTDYACLTARAAAKLALTMEIASCLCGLPPHEGMSAEVLEKWRPKVHALQAALESLPVENLEAVWQDYVAACRQMHGDGKS